MRIPQLSTNLRTGMLGLGMFMIALSTVAGYATSTETDKTWNLSQAAVVDESLSEQESIQCRPDQQDRFLGRLQSL